MTTFNASFDWDTNLPPSISSLDENDFLLLLQKQFPVVNSGDHPIAPSALSKGRPSVGATPQNISKFPLPASNSPLSTDSSPSPPSPNDDGSANGSADGHHKRTDSGDEDHHKRKASADDFDDDLGQPSAKSQHTDSKSRKTSSNTRRKSGGGEKTQDESRLLKRKEQNRAAQRAFRERKEKHVKDLEDKVAQLEAKTEIQATENENLRDMLSRLQNENVMLKQAPFTFSVPASSSSNTNNNNNNNASTSERRDSSTNQSESLNLFSNNSPVPGPSSVPASAGSSIRTASTHDSPSSLFEGFENFSGMQSSETPAASSSGSATSPGNAVSSPDLDTIAFFGAPGPFTTISSNPMFTSYRDPTLSMNAFASFGGWDGDVTMSGTSSAQDNTNSGLEELFGDQFSGLVPFSSDFLGDASGSPSGSSTGTRLSPVVHNKPQPSTENHSAGGCPKTKGDIERLVATGGKSTFGAPPSIDDTSYSMSNGSTTSHTPSRHNSDYDNAVDQGFNIAKKVYNDNCNIDELCLEMQRKAKCSYATTTGLQ